jgi:hypothetical protein
LSGCKPQITDPANPGNLKIYPLDTTIQTGKTLYMAHGVVWQKSISEGGEGSVANNKYMVVGLTVKNDDGIPRLLPPFILSDETGTEYSESNGRINLSGKQLSLDALGPGMQRSGILLFDVPPGHPYRLKVADAAGSSEAALIQVTESRIEK